MNISEVLLYASLALVIILCLIQFAQRAEQDDQVAIPLHVPMIIVDNYTAQEVFDWVAYVTKVSGKAYLEQLAWDHTSQHDFLLSDLRTVMQARSQEELLEHLKQIGEDHSLDTAIVSAPY